MLCQLSADIAPVLLLVLWISLQVGVKVFAGADIVSVVSRHCPVVCCFDMSPVGKPNIGGLCLTSVHELRVKDLFETLAISHFNCSFIARLKKLHFTTTATGFLFI